MNQPLTNAGLARCLNVLAAFLGMRDVGSLTRPALLDATGAPQADVMALFGGSILASGDVLADAMRSGVARTYVIVGGAGHTTEALRARVRELCPDVVFAPDAPEADVLAAYLARRHGLAADLLERRSTNCGNNVTLLLELLRASGVACRTMILSQDATMQRRMDAVLRREAPGVRAINFATYEARVATVGDPDAPASLDDLGYEDAPLGMWEPRRLAELLAGEIPRLTDDEAGYGPRGRGFIAHVDVPPEVRAAWERLTGALPGLVRAANPAFATRCPDVCGNEVAAWD